jgi:hypothetical protein
MKVNNYYKNINFEVNLGAGWKIWKSTTIECDKTFQEIGYACQLTASEFLDILRSSNKSENTIQFRISYDPIIEADLFVFFDSISVIRVPTECDTLKKAVLEGFRGFDQAYGYWSFYKKDSSCLN